MTNSQLEKTFIFCADLLHKHYINKALESAPTAPAIRDQLKHILNALVFVLDHFDSPPIKAIDHIKSQIESI